MRRTERDTNERIRFCFVLYAWYIVFFFFFFFRNRVIFRHMYIFSDSFRAKPRFFPLSNFRYVSGYADRFAAILYFFISATSSFFFSSLLLNPRILRKRQSSAHKVANLFVFCKRVTSINVRNNAIVAKLFFAWIGVKEREKKKRVNVGERTCVFNITDSSLFCCRDRTIQLAVKHSNRN